MSAVGVSAALLACGGGSGSLFGDGNNGGNGATSSGAGNQGDFSTDPVGTNAACVSAMKNAALPAVNLIQMYDKSGSMGDPAEGGDPNQRWIPVNTGMKAFFTDPASAGYNASLQFFPAPGDAASVAAQAATGFGRCASSRTPSSRTRAHARARHWRSSRMLSGQV